MNYYKTLTNALLLAVALSSGAGLTAHAQTITLNGSAAAATAAEVIPNGNQGYACVNYSLANPLSNQQTLAFTPGPANEVIDKWTLLGDGTAGISTTNSFSFYPTGFGKARVTVSYSYDTKATTTVYCPGSELPALCGGQPFTVPVRAYTTRTFDFFKVFTQAQANIVIKGPTCVPAQNPSVVYSVDPAVISQVSQIQGALGTDDYTWTVNYVGGGTLTPVRTGDGSAIIIRGAGDQAGPSLLTGSFNVSVKVGKCNAFSAPVLVTVASDINAAATLTGFPSCVPVGTTSNQTFTLSTVAGVNYTVASNGGGITISPASIPGNGSNATITLSSITATNSAVVTIVGTATGGTCFGTQTIVRAMNRQLVPVTQNVISPICVAPNATGVVLSMTNAPAGTTWSVPAGSGWTITNQTGNTATVNTGAAGTSVTVTTGTCGNIVQPVSVTGAVAGCTYTLTNTSDPTKSIFHQYAVTPTAGNACPIAGTTYTWTLFDASNNLIEGPVTKTHPLNANQFAYGGGAARPAPGYTVRVQVANTGNCLNIPLTLTGQLRPAAGGNTPQAATKVAANEARVYPNPSSDVVNIGLPDAAQGVARVTITDALGRVQQTLTTSASWTPVSVAKLPAGSYTVRVVLADGHTTTQNLLVNH